MTYREHIEQLLAELGVKARYIEDEFRAMAWPTRREAEIPHVDTERTYWIAMHELGHIALEHSRYGRAGQTLSDQEVEAWDWAISTSPFPFGPAGRAIMEWGLGSHAWHGSGIPQPAPTLEHIAWNLGERVPNPFNGESYDEWLAEREAYHAQALAA